jgi:hypothetical protein
MSGTTTNTLSDSEYDRRKKFLEDLKSLTISEYIEIARILQRFKFVYSENSNGIFFNVAALNQDLFDELEKYLQFTQLNKQLIDDRTSLMNRFEIKPLNESEKADLEAAREAITSNTHIIS